MPIILHFVSCTRKDIFQRNFQPRLLYTLYMTTTIIRYAYIVGGVVYTHIIGWLCDVYTYIYVYENVQVLGVLCVRRTRTYNNNMSYIHYHTIMEYNIYYLLLRYCVKRRVYYYHVVPYIYTGSVFIFRRESLAGRIPCIGWAYFMTHSCTGILFNLLQCKQHFDLGCYVHVRIGARY